MRSDEVITKEERELLNSLFNRNIVAEFILSHDPKATEEDIDTVYEHCADNLTQAVPLYTLLKELNRVKSI